MKYPNFIQTIFYAALFTFATALPAFAANDPSIKGNLRHNIIDSMNQYINTQSLNETMYVYDAVDGKLLKLTLDELCLKRGRSPYFNSNYCTD